MNRIDEYNFILVLFSLIVDSSGPRTVHNSLHLSFLLFLNSEHAYFLVNAKKSWPSSSLTIGNSPGETYCLDCCFECGVYRWINRSSVVIYRRRHTIATKKRKIDYKAAFILLCEQTRHPSGWYFSETHFSLKFEATSHRIWQKSIETWHFTDKNLYRYYPRHLLVLVRAYLSSTAVQFQWQFDVGINLPTSLWMWTIRVAGMTETR